jgi:lipoprotein-anchoring transpeptidase ErfK/SrfK
MVSTGTGNTPTPVGEYAIYSKVRSQTMSGPGYSLPNVEFVSYFYSSYAIHGTYWHNNFGQPMSHGCVNMRNTDAEWLYTWAPIGTPVSVRR